MGGRERTFTAELLWPTFFERVLPVNVASQARDLIWCWHARNAGRVFSFRFSVFSWRAPPQARYARVGCAVRRRDGGSRGTARSYSGCAPCTAKKLSRYGASESGRFTKRDCHEKTQRTQKKSWNMDGQDKQDGKQRRRHPGAPGPCCGTEALRRSSGRARREGRIYLLLNCPY
jgi:hypothetical protein